MNLYRLLQKRAAEGNPIKVGKIGSCFFKADESKTVNCVSAPAAAQHIEASIKPNQ